MICMGRKGLSYLSRLCHLVPQSRDRVIDAAVSGCLDGTLSRVTLFDLEDSDGSQGRNLSYCLRRNADDTVSPAPRAGSCSPSAQSPASEPRERVFGVVSEIRICRGMVRSVQDRWGG